jgi:hypothetical protein
MTTIMMSVITNHAVADDVEDDDDDFEFEFEFLV